MKRATTIEEQIEILSSEDRGMLVEDIEEAKSVLLDVGYYKLGFYCTAFECDYPDVLDDQGERKHRYKAGTTFSQVVQLYKFDCALRDLLGPVLHRIENNFRTKLGYYASIAFIDNPTWFTDSRYVTQKYINTFNEKVYLPMRKSTQARAIKKHHEKNVSDTYAPAWKTLEFMTFGALLVLYQAITDKDVREKIASCYQIQYLKQLDSFLTAMRDLRNLSAHSSALFDARLTSTIRKGLIPQITEDSKNTILGAIYVAYYLLKQISVEEANVFEVQFDNLIQQYKDVAPHLHLFQHYLPFK